MQIYNKCKTYMCKEKKKSKNELTYQMKGCWYPSSVDATMDHYSFSQIGILAAGDPYKI